MHPRHLLHLWHLLSLDAPSVAIVWACFTARCAGVALPSSFIVFLFLGTWVLYVLDRLLDAHPIFRTANAQLQARHYFHYKHRKSFVVATAVAVPVLLVTLYFEPIELLLCAVFTQLLFHHDVGKQ